jgi:hypothetical protein
MVLGDYLKHPLLYKYFPVLKMVPAKVIVRPPDSGEKEFSYNKSQYDRYRGIVTTNRGVISLKAGGYTMQEALSVLIHEVQHLIQTHEGYSGMNINAYDAIRRVYKYLRDRVHRKYRNITMSFADSPDVRSILSSGEQSERIQRYKTTYGDNWYYEFLD